MSEREKPKTVNLNVRLPPDLAAQVKQAAHEEGRSINSEILWALRAYLTRRHQKQPEHADPRLQAESKPTPTHQD
jgi:hypothetical protein